MLQLKKPQRSFLIRLYFTFSLSRKKPLVILRYREREGEKKLQRSLLIRLCITFSFSKKNLVILRYREREGENKKSLRSSEVSYDRPSPSDLLLCLISPLQQNFSNGQRTFLLQILFWFSETFHHCFSFSNQHIKSLICICFQFKIRCLYHKNYHLPFQYICISKFSTPYRIVQDSSLTPFEIQMGLFLFLWKNYNFWFQILVT